MITFLLLKILRCLFVPVLDNRSHFPASSTMSPLLKEGKYKHVTRALSCHHSGQIKLHLSYVELLGNSLSDLLNPGGKKVEVMEDKFGKVIVVLFFFTRKEISKTGPSFIFLVGVFCPNDIKNR